MSTRPAPPGPDESRVSRRNFLKAAGSGTLLTATTAAAVPFAASIAHAQRRWDREADVVVVGSGAAGSSAALFAREGGASVLMLEKGAQYGGTTGRSGGAFWVPNNYLMREKGLADPREDCLRYMARTAYPTLYNADATHLGLTQSAYDLIATFYDQGAATVDALRAMGALRPVAFWYNSAGEMYPDYYAQLPEDKAPLGRTLFPTRANGSTGSGAELIAQLKAAVDSRDVPVLLEHRATRLVVNDQREVVGLEATTPGGETVTVRARKGVIFGTGGFLSNPELRMNFLRGPIFGGCAVDTSEGDFIPIATAVGASLGNMAHAWWIQQVLEPKLHSNISSIMTQAPGDAMILVNRYGRRCVNEKIQYNERTQSHFDWDAVTGTYPNLVQMMVFDDGCRERHGSGGGALPKPGVSAPYLLSGRTLEALTVAIEARLTELTPHIGNFQLDEAFRANLRASILRFNQFAETGKDLDFHRGEAPIEFGFDGGRHPQNDKPNQMMYPISLTGPFYAVLIGGGALDTKGGPKTNTDAQVVDHAGRPIPRLYGAGNCVASPAGQAYWSGGGTIAPAMTFGAIAARHAVNGPVKEPS